MKQDIVETNEKKIKNKIYTIRDTQVMIDRDLANLYGVTTKALNQATKRNAERFPEDFLFQLTKEEKNELVTNCDRFQNLKHSTVNPYAFTEQGIAMLSGILKSPQAIKTNVYIMRSFLQMRKFISNNAQIFKRLDKVEKKQLKTDIKLEKIFNLIENKELKPTQGIFFDGQIFDSHKFVSDLIRGAKKSIILIDNYVDDYVLTLFTKRKSKVKVLIYTKNISKQLKLDLEKFNSQYEPITIKEFKKSHDRFLIIDDKELYHLGASLKDLGKKWFAFSKLDQESLNILGKLQV